MCPYQMDYSIRYLKNRPETIILKDIALNGSSTKYSVEQRVKDQISHGSVYNGFPPLINKQYIEEEFRQKWRTGQESVIYQITFKGLSAIIPNITSQEKFYREYNELTLPERYGSLLPLIFGKWNYLEERELIKIAQKRVESTFSYFPTKEEACESFFLDDLPTDLKTLEKWNKMSYDDSDIRKFVIGRLKTQIENLETQINDKQVLLQFFNREKGE